MTLDALIKMANQIGTFFAAMPDRPQALHDLALHLRRSWEPRMRQALLAHLAESGGAGLAPLVRQALERHRGLLE